jgi:hypothetical protein
MKVLKVFFGAASLLSVCAGAYAAEDVPPNDVVKTAPAAIQIARRACSAGVGTERSGQWHASLHNEIWHVWFHVSDGSTKCRIAYETTVSAVDGGTSRCTMCTEGT